MRAHTLWPTRPNEALEAIALALPLVQEFGLKPLEARLLQYRGIARFDLGDSDSADDIRPAWSSGERSGTSELSESATATSAATSSVLSPQAALDALDEGRESAGAEEWVGTGSG